MTKEEALREFKEYILPRVIERFGNKDKTAVRSAWVDYTDDLHRDSKITDNQVENWGNPF